MASIQFAVNGALYSIVGWVPAATLFIMFFAVGVLHGIDRVLPVPMLLLVAGSTLLVSVLTSILTVHTFPGMPGRLYALWFVDVIAYSTAYFAGWLFGKSPLIMIQFVEEKPREKPKEEKPKGEEQKGEVVGDLDAIILKIMRVQEGEKERKEPLF